LLAVQVFAGFFAVVKDIQYPFSNAYRVHELLQQVPAGRKIVCDYWAINSYSPYVDKPVYCIDLQKQADMVLFDNHLKQVLRLKNRYTEGMKFINADKIYMISTHPPESISAIDPQLGRIFEVKLIDKIEGAIEKFSNLYLYEIK
jgi:hypothetical protein